MKIEDRIGKAAEEANEVLLTKYKITAPKGSTKQVGYPLGFTPMGCDESCVWCLAS